MVAKTYANIIPSLGIYLRRSLPETVAVASAITQRRIFVAAVVEVSMLGFRIKKPNGAEVAYQLMDCSKGYLSSLAPDIKKENGDDNEYMTHLFLFVAAFLYIIVDRQATAKYSTKQADDLLNSVHENVKTLFITEIFAEDRELAEKMHDEFNDNIMVLGRYARVLLPPKDNPNPKGTLTGEFAERLVNDFDLKSSAYIMAFETLPIVGDVLLSATDLKTR